VLKLVDLMAAGCPVVAERVGQTAEYLMAGESGVLVPCGDVGAFAGALPPVIGLTAATEELVPSGWSIFATSSRRGRRFCASAS